MSWTDKELDNLFKEAAGKEQVPYNDAYWAEMEAMLGSKKKRRGAFWWWFSGAAVVLIGLGTLGYFGLNKNVVETKVQYVSNDQVDIVNENNKASIDNKDNEELIAKKVIVTEQGTNNQSNQWTEKEITKSNVSNINSNNIHINKGIQEDKIDVTNQNGVVTSKDEKDWLAINPLESMPKGNVLTSYTYDQLKPLPFLSTKRIGFYVEANGGIAQSYISSGNNIGWTTGVNAGVEKYKGNWIASIGLGARYESYTNIQTAFERKYYSFGAVYTQGSQQYNNFARIEMPIQLTYELGRWNLSGGVVPNYLLGVQTSASETMKDSYPGFNESTQFGYDGRWLRTIKFKPFGIKSHIGVGYTIASQWTINLSYQTQLTMVTNQEAFTTDVNRFPGMVQIGIRKRF